MNKILLTAAALIGLTFTSNAAILRCNNNPGISGANIYSTVQAAHNAASIGDTIHLEPSPNSYGSLNMTKRLYVVSIGGWLAENPGSQFSTVASRLDGISIGNTGANNSVISVAFAGNIDISNNVSGVQIRNCFAISWSLSYQGYINISGGANNILIAQNYFTYISLASSATNITVVNNIITHYIYADASTSSIFENNVIHSYSTHGSSSQVQNSIVRNNIYENGYSNYTNCTVTNNMTNTNFLPTGNGNINNAVMANVFVAPISNADSAYVLKAGSPAIGTGFGGVDMGAFGGPLPYRLGLQPRIPAITNITAPSVPTTNTINVNFSTKSN
jgi:hypothetical protein